MGWQQGRGLSENKKNVFSNDFFFSKKCFQSTMDGDNKAGAITTAQNSRVIRCAVLDISDPLNVSVKTPLYCTSSQLLHVITIRTKLTKP